VSVTHPTPLDGIDQVLAELPSTWVIGWLDETRLVIGPTGAFVLIPAQLDVAGAAERAQALAGRTRQMLARHLSWIPFIDAAVVTTADKRTRSAVAAVVVPVDLLGEVLIDGPPVIDQPALGVLATLLDRGELEDWQARPPTDVKIDLCETQPDVPRGARL
jgi:hypothetical protein